MIDINVRGRGQALGGVLEVTGVSAQAGKACKLHWSVCNRGLHYSGWMGIVEICAIEGGWQLRGLAIQMMDLDRVDLHYSVKQWVIEMCMINMSRD